MNQFFLQQYKSAELHSFPHIIEFACQKITHVKLDTFVCRQSAYINIFYILEGKFEWVINGKPFILYPDDAAVLLPSQEFGSDKGFWDVGVIAWITITLGLFENGGSMMVDKWSGITENESRSIGKLLSLNPVSVLSKILAVGNIFQNIHTEITNREIGHHVRTNQLIDELLITIVRHLTKQNNLQRDFPQTFMKLEQALRNDLEHQWLVEEMAAIVGLGITAFTEKVKNFTGFSPLHYLINLRISEAIKRLKNSNQNITDIALETGFYSSQHFANTFKKLTGYTPRQYRQNNTKNI